MTRLKCSETSGHQLLVVSLTWLRSETLSVTCRVFPRWLHSVSPSALVSLGSPRAGVSSSRLGTDGEPCQGTPQEVTATSQWRGPCHLSCCARGHVPRESLGRAGGAGARGDSLPPRCCQGRLQGQVPVCLGLRGKLLHFTLC